MAREMSSDMARRPLLTSTGLVIAGSSAGMRLRASIGLAAAGEDRGAGVQPPRTTSGFS
jgi:hypothetical protein